MFKYKKIPTYKYILTDYYCKKTGIRPKETITTKFITLTVKGLLFIRKGYCSDGASGPIFDTDDIMEDVFVHDALYQLMREGLLPQTYRKYADNLLREMCLESKIKECCLALEMFKKSVRYIRANYIYFGVRILGDKYTKNK